jgi:hypothetical protein
MGTLGYVVILVVVGLGLLVLLKVLDRLGLWLEERGLLFYRHRKPEGTSPRWLELQQFYEPRAEHVIEAREAAPRQEHEGERPDRLFPVLVALLGEAPVDRDRVRALLAEVVEAEGDWRSFYTQAVAWVAQESADGVGDLPEAEEVAPPGSGSGEGGS